MAVADGDDYVAPDVALRAPGKEKLRAGILGVSGAAGQQFLSALQEHPQFQVTRVYGQSSAGKRLSEIERYVDFDPKLEELIIEEPKVDEDLDLVFSALPSEPARELEAMFARHIPVISVSSAYRYEKNVPILIPEVNEQHAEIIIQQQISRGWDGFIVPGPNCTVVPVAITLAALREFEPKKVSYSSFQAVSGAGIENLRLFGEQILLEDRGVKLEDDSPVFAYNIIPNIDGEERKVRDELNKILGEYDGFDGGAIVPAQIKVGGTCVRVPVKFGHTLTLDVKTKKDIDPEKAMRAFEKFNEYCNDMFGSLHSSPEKTITIMPEESRPPQPYLDAELDGGMTTCVGRIRRSDIFAKGIQYVALSNNLKKGAAKGAVQTAEFLVRDGYIQKK